jgi:hypothetical protein
MFDNIILAKHTRKSVSAILKAIKAMYRSTYNVKHKFYLVIHIRIVCSSTSSPVIFLIAPSNIPNGASDAIHASQA